MPRSTVTCREIDHAARTSAIADAASALADGRLVAFPTETVYGVGANAGDPDALARFRDMVGSPGIHSTLHASDRERAVEGLEIPHAVHRRLLARLLPGPVRFEIQQTPEQIAGYCRHHGIEPGACDDGSFVSIRVPSHPIARRLLENAGVPVVAERLGAIVGVSDDRRAIVPEDVAGIDIILDDGPTPIGLPSTTVRLLENGGFDLGRLGAVEHDQVMKALERTIVFVCTGNTCRSPMAEAITRGIVAAEKPNGITTHVVSAGVAAGPGMAATPEAVRAVRELGYDFHEHRSRSLSRELLDRAEIIFAMTPAHLETVLAIDPEAADRAFTLDPSGSIPDPIGGGPEVYAATAQRIEVLVRRRLKELEP